MSIDLRLCVDTSHATGYSCARCQRTYCMTCDCASDVETRLTIVRYCPDWRCQREKKIEEGELEVVASAVSVDERAFAELMAWKMWH